jgi:hypothetical protein
MTSDACREMRGLIGAAALGRLEPAEEIALGAHLEGCAECRAEQRELAVVARALPLADPDRVVSATVEPPTELGDRVLDRVAHERDVRRSRRRVRLLAGSAATAVVAIAAALIMVFVLSTAAGPPSRQVTFPATPAGVAGSAKLVERPAGTEVAFHVTGLHDGDDYWLWLTGDDGRRIGAGTFRGTANSMNLTMTAAIPMSDARRVWVTDSKDDVVLDAQLR